MPRQEDPLAAAQVAATKLHQLLRDDTIDAATCRRRSTRLARRIAAALEALPAPPAYEYVTVFDAQGTPASISIRKEQFARIAQALGGRAATMRHARAHALAWTPQSGLSRSAFVRERLARRAMRNGAAAAGSRGRRLGA